jgi:hypothetical protein
VLPGQGLPAAGLLMRPIMQHPPAAGPLVEAPDMLSSPLFSPVTSPTSGADAPPPRHSAACGSSSGSSYIHSPFSAAGAGSFALKDWGSVSTGTLPSVVGGGSQPNLLTYSSETLTAGTSSSFPVSALFGSGTQVGSPAGYTAEGDVRSSPPGTTDLPSADLMRATPGNNSGSSSSSQPQDVQQQQQQIVLAAPLPSTCDIRPSTAPFRDLQEEAAAAGSGGPQPGSSYQAGFSAMLRRTSSSASGASSVPFMVQPPAAAAAWMVGAGGSPGGGPSRVSSTGGGGLLIGSASQLQTVEEHPPGQHSEPSSMEDVRVSQPMLLLQQQRRVASLQASVAQGPREPQMARAAPPPLSPFAALAQRAGSLFGPLRD